MLAACADNMEPAQKMLAQVQTALSTAQPDAQKYVPDKLKEVQGRVARLQSAFDSKDYSTVVTAGPAMLADVKDLATAAAGKKADIMESLNNEWTKLSVSVPVQVTAIQQRIDELSKRGNKQAKDIDVPAAKAAFADASARWAAAQAAFTAGNLEDAVSGVKDAKTKLSAIADAIKLPPPGAGGTAVAK
ncbi:MAG: hypothetical protein ABSF94_20855 [Steroidobacteraceae bacterium]